MPPCLPPGRAATDESGQVTVFAGMLTCVTEVGRSSVPAHVDESFVRDAHQVRDFVLDDVSNGGDELSFSRRLSLYG